MAEKQNEVLLNASNTDIRELFVKYGTLVDTLGDAFKIFSKYVKVFDLYFVATAASPDYKLLHGATVLYQYIDNNGDGMPDNHAVYTKLKGKKATMIMFSTQEELESHSEFFDAIEKRDDIIIQDLEADETRPGSIQPYSFDEALEECFHLVSNGYCMAYPFIFGLEHGSAISRMMDVARGGYFPEVPIKYPDSAWYTYYEKSCDYPGMIMEYIYWAMTTTLGAQQFRRSEIEKEWRPCTREELKSIDNPVYTLFTNPIYRLPTRLPAPVSPVQHSEATANESGTVGTVCGCGCSYVYHGVKKRVKRIKKWWIAIVKKLYFDA